MLRYGRVFQNKNGDAVSIHFYETESALLIKLLTFYVAAWQESDTDHYAQIESYKRKNAKNENAESE